jgi:deazaflavin-dependent oxidoreductase (nitroreductase family)
MNAQSTTGTAPRKAPLPPRWFIRAAWIVHRLIYRVTGGRRGLWRPTEKNWGTMRLRSTGRRTGAERIAILAYFEDGPNLVTLAMNGWGAPEPAWWLNLQANPDVSVDLKDSSRAVRARLATAEERPRLWARWRQFNGENMESYAARRPRETAVVILEPRSSAGRAWEHL